MHPPLTILDQTDELIAIEWLREHGYNTYAEHMEQKPEGVALFDCVPTQIWIHMTSDSDCISRGGTRSKSWTGSSDYDSRHSSITSSKRSELVAGVSQSKNGYCNHSITSCRERDEESHSKSLSRSKG